MNPLNVVLIFSALLTTALATEGVYYVKLDGSKTCQCAEELAAAASLLNDANVIVAEGAAIYRRLGEIFFVGLSVYNRHMISGGIATSTEITDIENLARCGLDALTSLKARVAPEYVEGVANFSVIFQNWTSSMYNHTTNRTLDFAKLSPVADCTRVSGAAYVANFILQIETSFDKARVWMNENIANKTKGLFFNASKVEDVYQCGARVYEFSDGSPSAIALGNYTKVISATKIAAFEVKKKELLNQYAYLMQKEFTFVKDYSKKSLYDCRPDGRLGRFEAAKTTLTSSTGSDSEVTLSPQIDTDIKPTLADGETLLPTQPPSLDEATVSAALDALLNTVSANDSDLLPPLSTVEVLPPLSTVEVLPPLSTVEVTVPEVTVEVTVPALRRRRKRSVTEAATEVPPSTALPPTQPPPVNESNPTQPPPSGNGTELPPPTTTAEPKPTLSPTVFAFVTEMKACAVEFDLKDKNVSYVRDFAKYRLYMEKVQQCNFLKYQDQIKHLDNITVLGESGKNVTGKTELDFCLARHNTFFNTSFVVPVNSSTQQVVPPASFECLTARATAEYLELQEAVIMSIYYGTSFPRTIHDSGTKVGFKADLDHLLSCLRLQVNATLPSKSQEVADRLNHMYNDFNTKCYEVKMGTAFVLNTSVSCEAQLGPQLSAFFLKYYAAPDVITSVAPTLDSNIGNVTQSYEPPKTDAPVSGSNVESGEKDDGKNPFTIGLKSTQPVVQTSATSSCQCSDSSKIIYEEAKLEVSADSLFTSDTTSDSGTTTNTGETSGETLTAIVYLTSTQLDEMYKRYVDSQSDKTQANAVVEKLKDRVAIIGSVTKDTIMDLLAEVYSLVAGGAPDPKDIADIRKFGMAMINYLIYLNKTTTTIDKTVEVKKLMDAFACGNVIVQRIMKTKVPLDVQQALDQMGKAVTGRWNSSGLPPLKFNDTTVEIKNSTICMPEALTSLVIPEPTKEVATTTVSLDTFVSALSTTDKAAYEALSAAVKSAIKSGDFTGVTEVDFAKVPCSLLDSVSVNLKTVPKELAKTCLTQCGCNGRIVRKCSVGLRSALGNYLFTVVSQHTAACPDIARVLAVEYIKLSGGPALVTTSDIDTIGIEKACLLPPNVMVEMSTDVKRHIIKSICSATANTKCLSTGGMTIRAQRGMGRFIPELFPKGVTTVAEFEEFQKCVHLTGSWALQHIGPTVMKAKLDILAAIPWGTLPTGACHPRARHFVMKTIRNIGYGNMLPADYKKLGGLFKCLSRSLQQLVFAADPAYAREQLNKVTCPTHREVKIYCRSLVDATKDPATFTVAELKTLAGEVACLTYGAMKKIPTDVLCDTEVEAVFTGSCARKALKGVVISKCLASKPLDVTKLATLKADAIAKVPPSALKSLTADAKKEFAKTLDVSAAKQMPASARRALAKSGKVMDIVHNAALMQVVSLKDFQTELSAIVTHFKAGNSVALGKAQESLFVKEYLKDHTKITATDLKALGSMIRSLSGDHFGKLEASFENVKTILDSAEDISAGKLEQVNELFCTYLKKNDPTCPGSVLDTTMVASIDGRAMLACDAKLPICLDASKGDTCKAICLKLGSIPEYQLIGRTTRFDLADACLKCGGENKTAVLMSSTKVSERIGCYMLNDFSAETIATLDRNYVQDNLATCFSKASCLSKESAAALVTHISTLLNFDSAGSTDQLTAELLSKLGKAALYLPSESLKKLKASELLPALTTMLEEFKAIPEKYTESCKRSIGESLAASRFGEVGKALFSSIIKEASGTSRRRKRAVTALTCDQVRALGDAVSTQMTAEYFDAMDSTEFEGCIEFLGDVKTWPSETGTSLVKLVKALGTNGTVGSLDTTIQRNLKYLATLLTAEELASLALDNDDVLGALGAVESFTTQQLQAVGTEWLTKKGITNGASVTADHLTTLSHFVCGLGVGIAETITGTVYQDASSVFRLINKCDHNILTALQTVASAIYKGTAWSEGTLAEIGIIAAALPDTDIAALTANELPGFTESALTNLPAAKVAAFSEVQLEAFGADQARVISSEQRASLTTAQKESLAKAELGIDYKQVSDSTIGGGTVEVGSQVIGGSDSSGGSNNSGQQSSATCLTVSVSLITLITFVSYFLLSM